jgi:hypothetical protein
VVLGSVEENEQDSKGQTTDRKIDIETNLSAI